ncbi:MAG TPA: ketoacyl-ACP synthase III [Hyphomicrobiaceae bacterium]|nr:ketoacyl-ACP synthase III [Hyphomicrobiaceae bacterium]
MVSLRAIGSFIPERLIDNLGLKDRFGVSEDFIRDKIGVVTRPVMAPGWDTADLATASIKALVEKEGLDLATVDCLVVCTQNPEGRGLPHTSAIVHGRLGLDEGCAAFDISLGCSGYVYGAALIQSFMEANGLERGLFVTADPYSKVVSPDDKNTALLFGDAATASLFDAADDASRPAWRVTRARLGTIGREWAALAVDAEGVLHMNGREIFNFAAVKVPVEIEHLLREADLTLGAIDLVLLHQASKYMVDTLQKRLKLPPHKVPFEAGAVGNTVSSTIPLLLERRLADPKLSRLLLSGFGVGLSIASCILERKAA